mmetsp:Transcript_53552/g.141972  ORF Transcript_53552/g.141972 Transcript_53552/m.141972 type:complete len:103 (+) Transcript_53552:85-393(+)
MALTFEKAKEAALRANALFNDPANAKQMLQFQQDCEGDISKFFQVCIPFASSILSSVIQEYGFEPSQNGCMQFTAELSKYSSDPEIAVLEKELKQRFMPSMS